MDLTSTNSQKKDIQVDIPVDAVPGSQRVEVSVTGKPLFDFTLNIMDSCCSRRHYGPGFE